MLAELANTTWRTACSITCSRADFDGGEFPPSCAASARWLTRLDVTRAAEDRQAATSRH